MISHFLYLIISITLWMQYTSVYADEVSTAKNKSIEITKGINGLDKVVLSQIHGSTVELYLYGAHVTSWKNEHGEELLFVSSKAIFQPPTAIRGGIPIIFPQFSNLGPLRSHGFARNRVWTIDNNPSPFPSKTINGVFVDLLLKPTEDDLKIWPHSFEYRLRVTLGLNGDLIMTSRIRNVDTKPFNFTFAYHNYFSVSNISEVKVVGMKGLDYLDNTKNRTRFTENRDVITINSEIDRIYLSTPKKVAVLDHKKKQTITVQKDGLLDAVVWNPWEERAKTIVDLGADDYKLMVCVEAAAIGKPIILKPGKEWKVSQKLSAR
ncbi:hypothetical protein L2E82_12283 [Cichorium intybus]|uniref:Uncharacterized protein n=1 Tax=Cichorium intybus TaxID=13427 RepID=A0ACB9GFH3_CICIN|nr:hypothetical protein L2E82_12283 [Cichorium intybus]